MKILIHGINYAPERTGIGKYTGEMSEWLAARDHKVRVVTAPPYYPVWQVGEGYSAWAYRRERRAGVAVWRCPLWVPVRPTGIERLLHLASFAASSFPVMLRQALWRPDVVMVIEPPLFCALQAWMSARLCGAKTLLHIQDFELDAAMSLGMLGKGSVQHILYKVEKFLMQGAARVSAISGEMRRRVVEKGIPKDRTWLFPNWSDVGFVRPMPRDNEVRWELGARPDDVLVLHTGNMGEKQGLDLVLDAADRLRDLREIKFAMIGDGVSRESLMKAVKLRRLGNVCFFPVQPLERLPLMLAAGDIHLVVQRREAASLVMPSKLTNILAAGRPSVATAEPRTALYDVLKEYDCGLVTAPGNAKELAAGIVALAGNPRERERLGQNARQYAESYLNKDKILSEFESRLQELVKEGA
jgi:colanic acid biosynthesis glycosyl transferase WcaI